MNRTLAARRRTHGIVVRTLLLSLVALLAVATAGGAAEMEGLDREWYEKHRMLMTEGETSRYQDRTSTWRQEFRDRFWSSSRGEGLFPDVAPAERQRVWEKRVGYAAEAFAGEASAEEGVERNGWETLRGIVFLFVGPPQSRFVTEESYPADELQIEDVEALQKHLAEDVPDATAGGDEDEGSGGGGIMNLDFGNLSFGGESEEEGAAETSGRVERWAYAIPGSSDVRVFTFADPDGNGALGLILDERIPAKKLARTGEEHRYDFEWFPKVVVLAEGDIQEVPAIGEDAAPAHVGAFTFRSADPARTHVRFLSSLDRAEIEGAGLDPEPFLTGKADVYLSVRDTRGAWVDQRILLAEDGYEHRGEDPVLVAIASELPPGSYRAEVLHVYGNRGVRGETDIQVPDYAASFGISTPLLTVATEPLPPEGSGLKKVKRSKAASRKKKKDSAGEETGQSGGFLYGRYDIVPHMDRPMRPGDVMAVYLQVYNCVEGSVDYEFFVDGESMGEWEPDTVTPAVSEFVRFQPLTDEFPEGVYEIRIRAEDAATGETVEGAVRFEFEL
jgi:GWxTD domain-containing protein